MATVLYDKIVFGPIHSRRLGISLGVNLLPIDGKCCSFKTANVVRLIVFTVNAG